MITGILGVALPPNLTELHLANNAISSLEWLILPVGLSLLDVRSNRITGITNTVCFPQRLQQILLGCNQIASVLGAEFPENLRTLDLSVNKIISFSSVILPQNLQHLDLSGNAIADISSLTFPQGCQVKADKLSRRSASVSHASAGVEQQSRPSQLRVPLLPSTND
jgi:Leucine-rich repeat (LRR) protein